MPLIPIGLGLYTAANPDARISQAGDFTNALTIAIDGKHGQIIDKLLYARNDDSDLAYSGIILTPVSQGSVGVDGGPGDFIVKLRQGSDHPAEEQWDLIDPGDFLTISGVLGTSTVPDTATYLPFWMRIAAPRDMDVDTILDIVLKAEAVEILVV